MISDMSEAMFKVRSADAGEAASACCFLARAIPGSEAALSAVMSYLWDGKRYDKGVGKSVTAYLPNPSLADVVHKHPDSDFRLSALERLSSQGKLHLIDASTIDDPMILGALSTLTGEPPTSQEVADFAKKRMPESVMSLMESHPVSSDAGLVGRLLREHGEKAIPALVSAAARAGESEVLMDEAASLLRDCSEEKLAALVAALGERNARKFVASLKKQTGKAQHELEYIIAKKSGDHGEIVDCLARHPSRREDAVRLVVTEGEVQPLAIKKLLPIIFALLDDDDFTSLWGNEPLRPAIVEAVGERMPSRMLADMATGKDRILAALAIGALSRKGQKSAAAYARDREI